MLGVGFAVWAGTTSLAAELRTFPLQHSLPQTIAESLRPLLDTGEAVIAAPDAVIVKADSSKFDEIAALISQLDRRAARFHISVLQSEIRTVEELNAELDVRMGMSPGSGIRVAGTGHVYASGGRETDESVQELKTIEGQPAQIELGESMPVVQNVYGGVYGNSAWAGAQTAYRSATRGVALVARLTADARRAVLEISPWSDRFDTARPGVVNTSDSHTNVEVPLGRWVELSALSDSFDSSGNGTMGHRYTTQSRVKRVFVLVRNE